jgi:hypothetical protein
MKKIIILISGVFCTSAIAQSSPPPAFQKSSTVSTTSRGLTINSRRGTLVEKQIHNLSKFKNLNIQKIVTKDLSDLSSESLLGIMYEYETYDEISKRTLTIDKKELTKLIQSLQTLYQKENEKIAQETKYKFVTMSNIEFGGIYSENQKGWNNYIRFPSAIYQQSLNQFSKDELKELIKILNNAEQEL